MPRLTGPRRSEIASAEIQGAFQRLFGDRDPIAEPGTATGSPGNWWTTMAIEPEIFHLIELRHRWQDSERRELAPLHRELAITRTGWARGSQFVFSQHCKLLRRLGISEVKISDIPVWSSSSHFDDLERLVLAYVDDLVMGLGRCPDSRFEALKAAIGQVAMLELTFITCTYDMSATMSKALRMEYDDRPDPVVEIPVPDETWRREERSLWG